MNAIVYLYSRKLKNKLKEVLKRPFELVLFGLFVALMLFSTGSTSAYRRDINELHAIVFAVYALAFVMTAKNGFSNGATMFSLADVNLIFTSPRKSESVLFYGLFTQLGRSALLAVFILYEYPTAHSYYGVKLPFLFAVILGYVAIVFLSQMLAMIIYSFTCDSDKKTKIAKAVFYGIIAVFVLVVFLHTYNSDNFILSVVDAINLPFMKLFPIVGFVYYGVIGFLKKKLFNIIIAAVYFMLFCVMYCVIIRMKNADFYEDVLKATEVSFSAITARKEGKATEEIAKNVKVGKTGFSKGEGASTIFQKHKIENRRAKLFGLDMVSIIAAVIVNVFAFFMKSTLAGFALCVYMSVFTVGKGRWAKELRLPYVYLIPEPAFKKLLNMLKEQLSTLIAESLMIFIPFYFVLKSSVFEVAALAFANVTFAFLFISANLVFQRFLGNDGNKTLIVFAYVIFDLFLSLGFIATFSILYLFFYLPLFVSLAAAAIVNIIISLTMLFLCRNVLECAEYNNK